MGSGSFPVDRSGSGQKLIQAAALVAEFLNEWYDSVYSGESGGGQYDNAASDGGSLALLSLANRLILAEVEKEAKRGE